MQPQADRHSVLFLPVFAVAGVLLGWLALADVGFRDSGEIGTAAFELGVAHPTGFAVDLLLLRAASLLPIGSVALRQNALIALEAALVLALLSALCERLLARLGLADGWPRRFAAALSAFALIGWSVFLDTATSVEVYTLALLVVLLAAYGVACWGPVRGLWACVLGFAPGLHVTAGAYAALLGGASTFVLGGRRAWWFLRAHAVVVLLGAAIVLYLPLASLRDPTLDWGDPETLGRAFDHLTAARIRSAYGAEMLGHNPSSTLPVLEQLRALMPLLPLALMALVLGARRAPLAVLGPLGLVAVDLAYAAWVNPMGAVDGQVGHVAGAGICLLAGLGFGLAYQALRRQLLRLSLCVLALLAAAAPAWSTPVPTRGDDFAASELLGSGGPLSALPARSVLVCSGDDACAVGLFALHVEAVRPDVDVVPAQHLWDPTVLRRLEGFELGLRREPPPPSRRLLADAAVSLLAGAGNARPVLFASQDPLKRSSIMRAHAFEHLTPYLVVDTGRSASADAGALTALEDLRKARFGRAYPSAARSRLAWSLAYATVGTAALPADPGLAVRALRIAAAIDPQRSNVWTNLGVALEANGALDQAVAAVQRAVSLDPTRATPWVNLARLQLRVGRPETARQVLRFARQAGVNDVRLDQLAAQAGH